MTLPTPKSALTTAVLFGLSLAAFAEAPAKVTYTDHILPIFRNACTNCHNPDKKKAGLDVTTYQGTLAGGENGPVIKPGNAAGSLMFKVCAQTEDPKMPPKGDRLSDADMELLKAWIAGFALENANSKPAQVTQNKVDVAVVSLTKPDGPPPMPGDLPLEPFVRSRVSNSIVAMAASPWAPLLAIGGQKQVLLYNTQSLERIGILAFPEGLPVVLRFSSNAKLLLAGGGLGGKLGKVVLWDVASGERIGVIGNEADAVLAADISPDQQFVALGGPGKQVKIFRTKDAKQTSLIKKHTEWITAIAYSPDGKYLATADRNGGVEVWESGAEPKPFNTLPGHKVACTALAFMPGLLASASEDGKISLWNVKEGTEVRSWAAHAGGVLWVDFTPDGRLVSCGRDKIAKVWDVTGRQIVATEAFADLALRCALNNDRVIAADWTGDIRVYGIDGKKVGGITANPPGIAEQLAETEKIAVDTQAALPGLQKAVVDAEANLKASRDAAEAKRKTDLSAAEQRKIAAQAAADAAKAAPGNAQKAVENTKAQIAAGEEALKAARKTANDVETAAASKQRANAEIAAAAAKANSDRVKAEVAKRSEERSKLAQGSPELAKAEQGLKALAPELAKVEQALASAEKTVAAAPIPPGRDKMDAAKAAVISAQQKLEGTRQQLQKAQAEFARVQGTAPKAIVEAQKSVQAIDADIAKLQQPAQRTASPEAVQKVAAMQKTFDAMAPQIEQLRAARAKFKDGTPDFAKASEAVQAKKAELAKVEADLNAARAAVATPPPAPVEQAVEKAKADLATANTRLAAAQAEVTRWKRAQLYQTVFNAKQTVAEKQAHYDDTVATAKDAFRQFELAKQGIVNADKTAADAPKTIAEKEQQLAKIRQTADAAKAALAAAEKAVADHKAAPPDAKTAEEIKAIETEVTAAAKKFEAMDAERARLREERMKFPIGTPEYTKANDAYQAFKPELAKAQAALDAAKAKQTAKAAEFPLPPELAEAVKKVELDHKLAAAKVPAAEKALAAVHQEIADAKKQAVELKGRIAQLERDGAKTKADAESAAIVRARELETAKAAAEQIRAQYEAAKKAAQKPGIVSATQP